MQINRELNLLGCHFGIKQIGRSRIFSMGMIVSCSYFGKGPVTLVSKNVRIFVVYLFMFSSYRLLLMKHSLKNT